MLVTRRWMSCFEMNGAVLACVKSASSASWTSVEVTTSLDGDRGEVGVVLSTEHPVPASRLARLLRERTGHPVDVEVEYRLHTTDTASVD